MNLISKIKSLFRDSSSNHIEPLPAVEYKAFTITPEPQSEGGQYRVSGWLRKGEQSHHFIRADVLPSQQACADEMVRKAKLLIDQQGDTLFQ